jgi:hypothetical protein
VKPGGKHLLLFIPQEKIIVNVKNVMELSKIHAIVDRINISICPRIGGRSHASIPVLKSRLIQGPGSAPGSD